MCRSIRALPRAILRLFSISISAFVRQAEINPVLTLLCPERSVACTTNRPTTVCTMTAQTRLFYTCSLNPLRLVCAQHPKTFFRCSTPQSSANDGAQKVLSTSNPILFRNTPGIPCPVLRFYKPPDFVHTAPDFVHTAPDLFNFARPAETRKRTSPLNPARKIFGPRSFTQLASCRL